MGDSDDNQYAEQSISAYNPSQLDSEFHRNEYESTEQNSRIFGKDSRQKLKEPKLKHLRSNSNSQEGIDEEMSEQESVKNVNGNTRTKIMSDFVKRPDSWAESYNFQLRSGRQYDAGDQNIGNVQKAGKKEGVLKEFNYKNIPKADISFELGRQVEFSLLERDGKSSLSQFLKQKDKVCMLKHLSDEAAIFSTFSKTYSLLYDATKDKFGVEELMSEFSAETGYLLIFRPSYS